MLQGIGQDTDAKYVESFPELTEPLPIGREVLELERRVPFVLGWALFGVSLGLGVLVGWVIWGL